MNTMIVVIGLIVSIGLIVVVDHGSLEPSSQWQIFLSCLIMNELASCATKHCLLCVGCATCALEVTSLSLYLDQPLT